MISWFLNSLVGLSQTNSGPAQTNKTLRTFCTFADVYMISAAEHIFCEDVDAHEASTM